MIMLLDSANYEIEWNTSNEKIAFEKIQKRQNNLKIF